MRRSPLRRQELLHEQWHAVGTLVEKLLNRRRNVCHTQRGRAHLDDLLRSERFQRENLGGSPGIEAPDEIGRRRVSVVAQCAEAENRSRVRVIGEVLDGVTCFRVRPLQVLDDEYSSRRLRRGAHRAEDCCRNHDR